MKGFGRGRRGKLWALTLVGVGAMAVGMVSVFVATAGGHSSTASTARRAGGSGPRRSNTIEGHLLYAERTKDVPAPPDSPSGRTTALVACPAGHRHVTGGGIFTSGGSLPVDVETGSTAPSGGGAWLGEANNDTEETASMTVTAICKKHGKFRYPDTHKANPGGGQILKGVNCPPGTKLTGGGVETNGDHSVEVASTEPADGPDKNSKRDDRWIGAANSGGMTVTAVCAKTGTAGIYRYTKSNRKDLPKNEIATAIANCPSGTHVTGGGVDVTGIDEDLEVKSSSPAETGGWLGTAINTSDQDEKVQAFAICKQ